MIPLAAILIDAQVLGREFSDLHRVGAALHIPRPACLYVTILCGVAGQTAWLGLLRHRANHLSSVVAGILLFSAAFGLLYACAAFARMSLYSGWLVALLSAWAAIWSGREASKRARSIQPVWVLVPAAITGALAVIAATATSVPQPWNLMMGLPDLNGENLDAMDLSSVYLEGFRGVTLEGASLNHANLQHAFLRLNMQHSSLIHADLRDAHLDNVDFTNADLRFAQLDNAKIYMVDFVNADLRGASLGVHTGGRINMIRADLRGADLSQAERLEYVYYWDDAIYDETTRWPEDFDPKALTCRWSQKPAPARLQPDGSFRFGRCLGVPDRTPASPRRGASLRGRRGTDGRGAPSSRGSSQRRHQQP